MIFANRCYNGGNLHRFQPRYDEVDTENVRVQFTGYISPEDRRRLIVRDIYIKDVCVWCGKEIKR